MKKQAHQIAVTIGITFMFWLVGCGSQNSAVSTPPQTSPPVSTQPSAPPPALPSAAPATGILLMRATPPTGVTVLSFFITVTSGLLEPGDVELIRHPVSVELSRLQVESSLLSSITIPNGNYTSISFGFANPMLTILNDSGSAIASCAAGSICQLTPALTNSSITLSGQSFPIESTNDNPPVLLVEFDLSRSLANLSSVTPVVTIQQLTPEIPNLATVNVKQATGSIVYTGGDDVVDGAFLNLSTAAGTIGRIDDSDALYVDATLCRLFMCVDGKIAVADLQFENVTEKVTRWEARRITLDSPNLGEIEGVIVAIDNESQFDMVLLNQGPSAVGLMNGEKVRINIQPRAIIECADTSAIGLVPNSTGLLFSSPGDLLVGQVVSARTVSDATGTPRSITTDRVRLKSGAISAEFKSISSSNSFVVDGLPGNLAAAQIRVETWPNTSFNGLSSIVDLKPGDQVSLNGFLFKTGTDPILLTDGVRKR
ncbi:MAG: hypothetical protein WAK20_12060 [Candidatus Acidiferrum sp.]